MADVASVAKRGDLIEALQNFVQVVRALLEDAEKDIAQGSLEDFAANKLRSMFGVMGAGAALYNRLSVKKRSEAEDLWKPIYQNADVRDAVEDLLNLEVEWDAFLERLDAGLQMSDKHLATTHAAEALRADMNLTDARTGDLLEARSVRVVVVSFGCLEGAQLWLQQTGCTFDMVLDAQRQIYKAFGLGSSYAKVMNFDCMLQYSEYVACQRAFPDVPPKFIDDIYQLGGDFLLDKGGKVLFSHPSARPTDRPKLEDLLARIS